MVLRRVRFNSFLQEATVTSSSRISNMTILQKFITAKGALARVIWHIDSLLFEGVFWSLLRLLRESFHFLHELLERIIALAHPPLTSTQFSGENQDGSHEIVREHCAGHVDGVGHDLFSQSEPSGAHMQHYLPLQIPTMHNATHLPPVQFEIQQTAKPEFFQPGQLSSYTCNNRALHSTRWWYVVARGRNPGLYECWEEASRQVSGYSGNKHKSFPSRFEAQQWLSLHILA